MAETQQDQDFIVSDAIGKTENFINTNKKSLGIIIGALVVAVGGYLYYQKVYVANKEKEAEATFFHAEQYFFNDSLKKAVNGDGNNPGLEEIASDYGVSKSGNLARYYLGMTYMKSKEYDKAIEELKSYDASDDVTGALAFGAIGDAYMETKNTDDAITFYEKASKEKPNTFTTPLMLMKLAIAQEMKKDYAGAKETYQQLKKDYPTSNEGSQADKYIARAKGWLANKYQTGFARFFFLDMSSANQNLSKINDLPDGSGKKFSIIVSEWNAEITEALFTACYETLLNANCKADQIRRHNVPGSFELPFGAKTSLDRDKPDAVICLGCVIRGETRHFDFICNAVSNGIMDLGIQYSVPVIFGVLTTENQQQALDRSGGRHGNKGIEAAVTALKMAIRFEG